MWIRRTGEAVERGQIDRLMIFMPPGHAKSTYGSIFFPAWYLWRNPDRSLIAASHTAKLAAKFGRRARNLIDLPESNTRKLPTASAALYGVLGVIWRDRHILMRGSQICALLGRIRGTIKILPTLALESPKLEVDQT